MNAPLGLIGSDCYECYDSNHHPKNRSKGMCMLYSNHLSFLAPMISP